MACAARISIAMLGLLSCALAATARAQSSLPGEPPHTEPLESVLVVGEQPGPGLWKVSKDGNVLWLLATVGPLPDKLAWRSRQVEAVFTEAPELYTEPLFQTYVGSKRDDQVLLSKARRNVTGTTLKDLLPSDLYQQFVTLTDKYANGLEDLEDLRPYVAAGELRRRAMVKVQLTWDGGVRKTIRRLAKRHRVTIRSLTHEDNSYARPALVWLDAIPRDRDIPCFQSMLATLEADLQRAAVRANAWAIGDIAALRESVSPPAERALGACSEFLQPLISEGEATAQQLADQALRGALQRNRSTLALIPIAAIFDPQGILARFRADGYEVEEP